jgi:glycosyltransferase involved in cell wall biosynthesis
LIVIDNGSTDGTGAYLGGVQDAAAVPVIVISNKDNRGLPAAINQGLQQARGEYLVLLNNDVVVTDAWLDQLIALAEMRIDSLVESNPLPQGGRRLKAQANVEHNSRRANLTVVDFNGGEPVVVDGTTDDLVWHADSSAARPADSASPVQSQIENPKSKIGLVGPMSNYAAPPQLVENVPYRDIDAMHRFARTWRGQHRGQWFAVSKLSGFCLLMKRAVYEAIGGLDERFGLGFFDDDDLAERGWRAGFELAVAHDLYVHHFGSRTFAGNGVDAEKLLDENAGRFAAKWGLAETNGRRVALTPFDVSPLIDRHEEFRPQITQINADSDLGFSMSGRPASQSEPIINSRSTTKITPQVRSPILNLRKSAKSADKSPPLGTSETGAASVKAKVSLTMIVRDEQNNLPACLESVRGVFDEIVVVDTGSTDRTAEIARSFGARVFDFVWVDDFAAARNAALARATGDYAFWLDADDVVEPAQRQKLEDILKRLRKGEDAAYVVRCACDPSPDGTGGDTVVDHIRLFPLREGVRWTYRVHEQILPALRRANIPVEWTDLIVRHTGYVDQALRSRKLDRDTRILMQELEARPDDPFTLFNLGAIAGERKDWNGALGFLKRSLAGSAPSDSIVRKLYALIARAHQMLGESQAALETCAEGLELDPGDAELWFRKAVVHRHRGESGEAEQCWRRILHCKRPDQFCSLDQGIYGHLTRRNLAALAAERGDHAETKRLWREVLAECPGDREALAKLNGPPRDALAAISG